MFLEHKGQIVFDDNEFKENISYNGAIQISKKEGPVIIKDNYFYKNNALVNANALSIQMGADSFTDDSEIADESSSPICGGILLDGNEFKSNLGCAQTSGIASIQCLKAENWVYSDELGVYSFPELTEMEPVSESSEETLEVKVDDQLGNGEVEYEAEQAQVEIKDNEIENNYAGL